MKGVVKTYNSEKGFGFITSDDGDIFFHINNVKNKAVVPVPGMAVEFQKGENEKGDFAQDITLAESTGKPVFIKLGNDRIKISNIKDYGIYDDSDSLLSEFKRNEKWIIDHELDLRQLKNDERTYWNLIPGREYELNEKKREQKELENSIRYQNALRHNLICLYLTTYQGNYYKYYECLEDWDINEKLKLLDTYLCE